MFYMVNEKIKLSLNMLALALTMVTIAINSFVNAGFNPEIWVLYLLGVVSGIGMLIFLVLGILLILKN